MFKVMSDREETKKSTLKKEKLNSKKKPSQPKEEDNRARLAVKVKGGTTEECVARPFVMRAQAKKSDK